MLLLQIFYKYDIWFETYIHGSSRIENDLKQGLLHSYIRVVQNLKSLN